VSSVPAVRRGCVVVSLDEYQRTLDASRLRQRANLRAAHRPDAESLPSPGETLAALAARYGVSERLLRDAYTIRTLAPDQLAAVAAGDIPVHRLANRLRQTPPKPDPKDTAPTARPLRRDPGRPTLATRKPRLRPLR
jgi:hypothetical protein